MATLRHQERHTQPAPITRESKPTIESRVAPFMDHVRELRTRAFWVAAVFLLGSALAYQFQSQLVAFALAPLGNQKLVYLTPGGGFTFIFQLTMVAGALCAAPFLIYHLYRFVAPTLPKRAQQHTFWVFFSSVALTVSGVTFGYFVAVPAAIHFLTGFAASYISASLTADSYLNFVLTYLFGLGLLFQLPLLLVFWHWINPLSPRMLLNSERYLIVAAFILAAVITPTPDIFNQCIIAVPIILIYQIGVVAVWIMGHRSRARQSHLVYQPASAIANQKHGVVLAPKASALSAQLSSALENLQSSSSKSIASPPVTQSKGGALRRTITTADIAPVTAIKTVRPVLMDGIRPKASATSISSQMNAAPIMRSAAPAVAHKATQLATPRAHPRPALTIQAPPRRTSVMANRVPARTRGSFAPGYGALSIDGFGAVRAA